jgi:hypothetical protein
MFELLASRAVAQRDRHRPFGPVLADDVAVQLPDDLTGREVHRVGGSRLDAARHVKHHDQISSTVSSSLV